MMSALDVMRRDGHGPDLDRVQHDPYLDPHFQSWIHIQSISNGSGSHAGPSNNKPKNFKTKYNVSLIKEKLPTYKDYSQ